MKKEQNSEISYNAFISYRHLPLDSDIAARVLKILESFRLPGELRKQHNNIQRVFRDREELPTSVDLSKSISEALIKSENLIVVCSRNTPGSMWVDKEVETFCQLGRVNHIFVLWIEGSREEAFPTPLLALPSQEESEAEAIHENSNNREISRNCYHIIDIRGRNSLDILRKLNHEKIRLCSHIIGCDYSLLKAGCRKRKGIYKVIAALAVLFIISVLPVAFYVVPYLQEENDNYEYMYNNDYKYRQILQDCYQNMEDVSFLYFEMSFPVTGSTDELRSMLESSRENLGNIVKIIDSEKVETDYGFIENYAILDCIYAGDLELLSGNRKRALGYYQQAIDKYQLTKEHFDIQKTRGAMYAYKKYADTNLSIKCYDTAGKYYEESIGISLLFSDCNDRYAFDACRIRAKCYMGLSECGLNTGNIIKARESSQNALSIYTSMAQDYPDQYDADDLAESALMLTKLYDKSLVSDMGKGYPVSD